MVAGNQFLYIECEIISCENGITIEVLNGPALFVVFACITFAYFCWFFWNEAPACIPRSGFTVGSFLIWLLVSGMKKCLLTCCHFQPKLFAVQDWHQELSIVGCLF